MRKTLRRISYLFHRDRLTRELADEMAAHRDMMAADRRRAFGSTARLHDEIRQVWGWQWLDDLQQDLAHGVCSFLRDRRLTLSALTVIGLAIGAATAVFSVVDRSLFRPLPYHRGDQLVTVGLFLPAWGAADVMFAGAFHDWQSTQTALDLTSWSGIRSCDFGGESPASLNCARAEAAFLPTLGVQPLLGRNFTPDEDRAGAEPVALLSYGLWRSSFAANPAVLGTRFMLDGTSTHIVGVLPPAFETPDLAPADLLIPQRLARVRTRNVEIKVIGRLRSGHTLESATAALEAPFQAFRADFGARAGDNFAKTMRLRITGLRDQQTRQYRLALWMLLGAVLAFVLIACANVGNLLLARSTSRRQEFAIRAALGAARSRLIRQTLAETALLAVAGGAASCLLAGWLLRIAIALAPDGALRLRQATLDARVLAFALLLSLAAAFLFALGPSLHRVHTEALNSARSVSPRQRWMSQALITAEISLSLVLLTAAGLLLMSLWRLQNAPLGFASERVITASFVLPQYRYPDEARQLNFFQQLEERLNHLPGTVAAAITDSLPPDDDTRRIPLANKTGSEIIGSIRWRYVTPGYFAALGIPIKLGRPFSDDDRRAPFSPVILSESLWRSRFGSDAAIGQRIGGAWPRDVVGVAADVRNNGLSRSPEPEYYVLRQLSRQGIPGASDPAWPRRGIAILRSTLTDQGAAATLQAIFHDLDPALPIKLDSMSTRVDRLLTRPRFETALLSVFAFTGLILVAVGLYGLISFLVAERTREIGVRIALGASPADVVRMVVADAGRWTIAGVVIGLAASTSVLRLLQTLLYEVKALDARAFAAAAAVLSAVALAAAWIPARRASRVAPLTALRDE